MMGNEMWEPTEDNLFKIHQGMEETLGRIKNNLNKQEDKVKMDYQSEQKRLEEGRNYWKPKVGQHKVKA